MTRLSVRVQPGARRERIVGRMDDGTLKISVRAAPEGGKANEALARFVANMIGVPATTVRVIRGRASRTKTIEVEALAAGELDARIQRAVAAAERGDAR